MVSRRSSCLGGSHAGCAWRGSCIARRGFPPAGWPAGSRTRREVSVSLLDARAGSPPTAVEFLRRHVLTGHPGVIEQALHEWERWSAALLESHMSYPVLGYFRSQHDHQSWVAALTAVLDAS